MSNTPPIMNIAPASGRIIKEDGTVINLGDILSPNPGSQQLQKTGVQLYDNFGRAQSISAQGDVLTGELIDDISVSFQYGLSYFSASSAVTGTGAVTQAGSMLAVSPGTGVGSVTVQSVDAIRYVSGHEVRGIVSHVFAAPEPDLVQKVGFQDNDDAWAVGYNGTEFGLFFKSNGVEQFIAQSAFNIDHLDGTGPSAHIIDPLLAQLYRLSYTWHGFMALRLEVIAPNPERYIPVHQFTFINQATTTHLGNPSLPLAAKIERLAGTGADSPMFLGSWRGGCVTSAREFTPADRWFSWSVIDAAVANSPTRTNIFTIRNKATFNGKTNHISNELAVITFDSNLNKSVLVYGTLNATITGGGAWQDVSTGNCTCEISEGGTVTGGLRVPSTIVRSGTSIRLDVRNTGIVLHPGQSLTLEVAPTGTVTGTFSVATRFVGYH